MTPEQLQELRATLQPLGESCPQPALLQQFLQDYSLQFSDRVPKLEYRAGTVSSQGYTLAVHRWQQPGASHNLLLLHGYFDHTGLFGNLIEYGLSRNCNVLIFDLPGHGLSSGEQAAIDDFREYARAIDAVLAAAQLPELPVYVMAQSTGCAALVEYARHYSWPFAAVVMLAPLVRPARWHWVRAGHVLLHRFVDSVSRRFTQNSNDAEFPQFLQQDPLQSHRVSVRWVSALRRWLADLAPADLGVGAALVIQGDADRTVDWHYNLPFIAGLFPGSQIHLLPGGRHQLANESAALRSNYLEQVDRYLGLAAGPAAGEPAAGEPVAGIPAAGEPVAGTPAPDGGDDGP